MVFSAFNRRHGAPNSNIFRVSCIILLLNLLPISHAIDGINSLQSSSQLWWGIRTPHIPRFMEVSDNVTVPSGDSAFLSCSVEHLGDKSVTWMRCRDLHILTAGVFTYSADDRFRVIHPENTNDWTLEIKFTTPRDSGMYECQVNSDTKISRNVFLKIKEHNQLDDPGMFVETSQSRPSVYIEGASVRHIQKGSVLSLTCVITHQPRRPPKHLHWFRDQKPLDYDSTRGGVSVQTEKQNRRTVSRLSIASVTSKDTGRYFCNPSGLEPFSVMVHAQDEQYHAAVQQGGLSFSPISRCTNGVVLTTLMSLYLRLV